MKTLVLIRHAKSSWKNPVLSDVERPLNKRGKKDAPLMAKRLKKTGYKPDLMISSPAQRALKTAKIFTQEINYSKSKIITDNIIYEGSLYQILQLIKNIDDSKNCVFLYGHNPDLTSLANYLSDYKVTNIPTCGVFCVDFEIDSWRQISETSGIFKFFDFPKKQPESPKSYHF